MDDGKDWTWYAALTWPRAPRTLYKAWARREEPGPYTRPSCTIIYNTREPSARRPWVGRTDAEQEENWERNWESDKKRLARVKALTLPSTILYFCHPVFQPSCISALMLHDALNSDKLQRLD